MIRRRMLMIGAALTLLAGACATTQDTPARYSIITLEKSVHFPAPDGADVLAAPGRYEVGSLEETKLRLIPAEAAAETSPLIVAAMALPHKEAIESPVALSVPNGEDEHHIVLLMPDRKGLDAGGTYSGLRSRGGSIAPLPMVRVQAAFLQQGIAISDPHAPPAFYVVSYGGKCLDFGPPPQVSGAPVFIYGCNGTISQQVQVQEINDRHEVILRAGTKVIGVKRSTQPPAAVSRAVVPDSQGNATFFAPPLVMVPVAPSSTSGELLLELQDESNRQAKISALALASASASGQVFALDGDSIILASDRTSVVKVLNNRGMNRTPLVLGSRDLADNEFWTFQAVDRSGRYPTSGFVRVSQAQDFVRQAQQAKPGTVIDVDPGASIDLTISPQLAIPEGVTIRSNRRGTNFGAELRTSIAPYGMLDIAGNDVRITGLRLHGPTRSTDENSPEAKGIRAHDDKYTRSLIDHNDISDWTLAAVEVLGGNRLTVCLDHRDNPSLPSRQENVRVARNFIHHNERQEIGYGVGVGYGGYVVVEGNTFVSNRHAITGDGTAGTSYRALDNLVLWDAPKQHGLFYVWDFDMHGTGTKEIFLLGIKWSGGFGGIAGDYMEIGHNTFLGTNQDNFHLRGNPCYSAEFHHNVSLKSYDESKNDGDAVDCDYCDGGINKLSVHDNLFGSINPTGRLGVGDFDGDGVDDLFLATGVAWYYAPQANAEWRFLNAQTDPIGNLLFGDFDGDGRTDVFTQHGRDWLVSWGGASSWEKINESNPALSEFRIGDFNGDHLADVFYTHNNLWYISYGGTTPLTVVNSSSIGVHDLGFGDFNGDGKTDVVASTSGQWMVSLSATGPWAGWPLRPAMTNTMAGLIIADFNGNGRADIATAYGGKVSYDGRGDWVDLPARPGTFAAVGRFDMKPGADIVFYGTGVNFIDIQSSGNGAPARQSRQDMR